MARASRNVVKATLTSDSQLGIWSVTLWVTGASRRTRHGSVWVSMPLGVLVVAALVALPVIVNYIVIKALIIAVAWLFRTVYHFYQTRKKGRGRE